MEQFLNSPRGKLAFPQDVCDMNSLSDDYKNLFSGRLSSDIDFGGKVQWIFEQSNNSDGFRDAPFDYIFCYAICDNGSILNFTAFPKTAHLKTGISESTILEKVNQINSINPFLIPPCFSNLTCAIYDKNVNEIYFKWSWGLLVPPDYLKYYIIDSPKTHVACACDCYLKDLYEL